MGYSLDQKASNTLDQNTSQRGQSANDNSGIHNSILTWTAGGNLSSDLKTSSGGIGQAMTDIPIWVWIAAILGAVILLRGKKKKK